MTTLRSATTLQLDAVHCFQLTNAHTSVVKVETGYSLFFSLLLSAAHQVRDKKSNEEGALHRNAKSIGDFLNGELSEDTIGPDLCKVQGHLVDSGQSF